MGMHWTVNTVTDVNFTGLVFEHIQHSCLSVVRHECRQARPVLCSKLVTALVVASCTGKFPCV